MDAAMSALERVDPQLLIAALLIVLSWGAVLALAICWRIRSDRKAAAIAKARRPRRLPVNLAGRPLDFDEYRRPY